MPNSMAAMLESTRKKTADKIKARRVLDCKDFLGQTVHLLRHKTREKRANRDKRRVLDG